ncbi:transposase [Flavobacteriaceae bacterium TK19130]|nr:transposase [Thermobacterium salinum]
MIYQSIIADNYYHIYNRGNNYENIFIEEMNYAYFLKLLEKYVLEVSEVLAYCLLKNHFHLLLKTKENVADKSISQRLSNLFNAYAKAINKKYGRNGSLFKDRFSRKLIEDERYLKNLIIYIHVNPVHHQFVENFKEYKHSSYQELVSEKITFLSRDFVINLFDSVENFEFAHLKRLEIHNKYTFE